MPGLPGVELTEWHVDFTARLSSPDHLVHAFDEEAEPLDQRNQRALTRAVARVNELPATERTDVLGGGPNLATHRLPHPDIAAVYAAFRARNRQTPITERGLDAFALTTAPGYVGCYEANGCIVMGQFGDARADRTAYDVVAGRYPDRTVIQISTDGLAVGGGTIHCATQQVPRPVG